MSTAEQFQATAADYKQATYVRVRGKQRRAPIGALCCFPRRIGIGDQASVISPVAGSTISAVAWFLRRPGQGGATAPGGLLQTIAVAVHGQNMDMMGQPVEQWAEPLPAGA